VQESIAVPREGYGPELSALLVSRQWFIIAISFLGIALGVLPRIAQWTLLSPIERLIEITAVALFVVGAVLRRRTIGLWILVSSVSLYVIPALTDSQVPVNVSLLSSTVAMIVFAAATLLPRIPALIVIVVIPIAVHVMWLVLGSGGLEGWYGWTLVFQRIVSGFLLLMAWQYLYRESLLQDTRYFVDREQWESALQERARRDVRREVTSRVHEGNLNVHRALLAGASPQSNEFREHLRSMSELAQQAMYDTSNDDIDAVDVSELAPALRSVLGEKARLHVDPESCPIAVPSHQYQALRSAALEIARNEVDHGAATQFWLTWTTSPRGLTVTVQVPGGGKHRDYGLPGMGRSRILGADLLAVGGSFSEDRRATGMHYEVTIPLWGDFVGRRTKASSDMSSAGEGNYFGKARLLLTAAIMGGVLIAPVYAWGLILSGMDSPPIVILSVMMAVPMLWIAMTRQRLRPNAAIFSIVIPAAVPWVSMAASTDWTQDLALGRLVSLASYAVFIIGIWSNLAILCAGFILWGGGVITSLLLSEGLEGSEALSGVPTSILGIIPVAILLFFNARRYARVSETMELAADTAARLQAQSRATAEVRRQFGSLLEEDVDLVERIISEGSLTRDTRNQILVMDGRIRAAILVDPISDGGFSTLAYDVVSRAAEMNAPVSVRAIQSSDDVRPLPAKLVGDLVSIVAINQGQVPTMYGFTNGHVDHLIVTVDCAAATDAGFSVGDVLKYADAELTVESLHENEGSTDRCRIHLSRTSAQAHEELRISEDASTAAVHDPRT
jgi:hypothetical protein